MLVRLKRALDIDVNKTTLFFYDRINLVPIKKNDDNNYREYTEKDYVKLNKAILLSRLGVDLPVIDNVLNKNSKEAKEGLLEELKRKAKWIRLLKLTI